MGYHDTGRKGAKTKYYTLRCKALQSRNNLLTFQRKAFFCKHFTGFHAVTTQKTKVYSHGHDNLKYRRSSKEYPNSFKVRNEVPKQQAIPQNSQFYLAILKSLLSLLSLSWLLKFSRYILLCLMCFMLSPWLLHFGSCGRRVPISQIHKSIKLMLPTLTDED